MKEEPRAEIAEAAENTRSGRAYGSVENEITDRVIAAAIEVHRGLGAGLLESAYEECLCYELSLRGIRFQRQVHLPVSYKGLKLDCAYKVDLLVADLVIVELKTVEDLTPVHKAQLLTYLRASNKRVGLLINFNVPVLRNGLKRIVNRYAGPAPTTRTSASSAFQPEAKKEPSETQLSSPGFSPRLRDSAFRSRPL